MNGHKPAAQRVGETLAALLAVTLLLWAWRADVEWFDRHWLENYCVVDARTVRRISLARGSAVATAILTFLVVRPRLGRWLRAQRGGELARAALRISGALVLALIVSEGWRRTKHVDVAKPYPLPVARPTEYGWELVRQTTKVYVGGRDLTYSVNDQGMRVRTESDVADPRRPSILFAGESITFGLGVEYEETYPPAIGEHLGLQPVNIGVHGYGVDQAYLRVKDVLSKFSETRAVVVLFVPDQVIRTTWEVRSRFALREDGSFEKVLAAPEWVRELKLRALWKDLVPYRDDEALELTRAFLRATLDVIRARGAVPLFVVTNCKRPCLPIEGASPWIIETLFEREHLPYVRVDIDPAFSLPGDVHPDPRGQRRIGAVIEDALRRANVGAPPP